MVDHKAYASVSVLIPGYACECQRCGHVWSAICECPRVPILGPDIVLRRAHRKGCVPPRRCARCKSPLWQIARGVLPQGRRSWWQR